MANGPSYARWSLEPYSIGMKLRTLRTQKHLTLSRLAAETGLSTALLSKLETDRMIPTLPTLANICRVYGVGLSHFFSDATKQQPLPSPGKPTSLETAGDEAAKEIPLHALSADARLVARIIEYPSGAAGVLSEVGHSECSVVYVLEGTLHLDGGIYEILENGVTAPTSTVTWPWHGAPEIQAVVALSVVTPGTSRRA